MNFSLKPVFLGWVTLLCQLPLQIFLTIWCGGFFGAIFSSFIKAPKGDMGPHIIAGGIAFFAVPMIFYFGKKLNYGRTDYKFHDDRLEFEEGFLTINKKVIHFKDVKEITLRKGIFQRMYGLGSVYLATYATGAGTANMAFGFGSTSASGVTVRDVQDPDDIYEKIRALVDKARA